MNPSEDQTWQRLLACSTPTFSGDAVLPYGFMTGTLARLREERRLQQQLERIGWRALLASLVMLAAVVVVTAGLQVPDRNDLDPGVRSLIAVDNIPIS